MKKRVYPILVRGMHLRWETRVGGFEPSTGSLLLANNIVINPDDTVADIGTGSGLQGITAALLGAKQVDCTDTQPLDISLGKRNAKRNGASDNCRFHLGNMLDPINISSTFDVIIFNLPQTPSSATGKGWFQSVLAGADGSRLLVEALRYASNRLNSGGRVYFVLDSITNRKKVLSECCKYFHYRTIASIWVPWRYFELQNYKEVQKLILKGNAYEKEICGVHMYEKMVIEGLRL